MREHAARAGFLVDLLAGVELHVVGQERVGRIDRVGAADARDLGVAVEEDLLEVVGEHQVLDRLRLADERRVPARLADRLALRDERLDRRALAQEVGVHVHHELALQRVGARLGELQIRRLALLHRVQRRRAPGVGLVHRDERRRHAGGGLEERAAAHAVPLRELRAERLHARLELALLRRSAAPGMNSSLDSDCTGIGDGNRLSAPAQALRVPRGQHAHRVGSFADRRAPRTLGVPASTRRHPTPTAAKLSAPHERARQACGSHRSRTCG